MKYSLAIAFWICSLNAIGQLDTTSNLSDAEKIYGLSVFWKEASYNFAYFDKTRINWDSAYQAYIPLVLGTKSTFAYYRVLQKFSALLKDGHTDIQMPFLSKGSTNTQVHFDYLEDKVIVSNVILEDSALVPFGAEVIEINGAPIGEYLESKAFPYISSSTNHWRNKRAMNLIYPTGDTSKSIKLKLKTPEGNILYYTTKLTTKNKKMAYDNRLPKFMTYKEFPGQIAYVNLYTFQDTSAISRFKKYLPELYKAKGIILDLRNNGGGNSDVGVEILKYFTRQKKIKSSAGKTRDHIASFKAWGKYFDLKDTLTDPLRKDIIIKSYLVTNSNYWYYIPPDIFQNNITVKKIEAPLIILIGNETASAAEDFLVALDDIKGRATTVGEKTEGSTGQPLYFDLPGGGKGRVCTLRETYPDGREFVGIGIHPEVEVKRTVADLLKGKDAALEKALEILASKKKNN
jgi:C-terminal processing protease CtpA/Prc